MRTSQYHLATLRESPADAEIISHQLMFRAGLIRKLASGLYSWLPTGLRVLQKVSTVVREEMNAVGAQEMLMPIIQPAELWHETGRWEKYGPMLLRMKDRHEREFCFGPTHEEVITDLFRGEIQSYKQLPMTFYQLQTKFRDEIRPRFGVMRAREFVMKDAYSFHVDQACLEKTYDDMYGAYCRVFERLGLRYRAVIADSGEIGGSVSHEFHVLADTGEDVLAVSDASDYAANVERAETLPISEPRPEPTGDITELETPHGLNVEAQTAHLGVPTAHMLKTLLVEGEEDPVVALALRGDHRLNEIKAANHPKVKSPLTMVSEATVKKIAGCAPGFVGPKNLEVPIIADYAAAHMANFICGANADGKHHGGINWGKDMPEPETADLRDVEAGDASPDGQGTLTLTRGIEVGHIFQLGDKYSSSMDANVLNDKGREVQPVMGCYGIGVSRIVAAAIEQNHDENGIVWPEPMAPFKVVIIPMNQHKSYRVREAAEKLYQEFQAAGVDVLLEDRKERPGVMFKDAELIGIPHRLVLGERGLDNGTIEYQHRQNGETIEKPLETIVSWLASR